MQNLLNRIIKSSVYLLVFLLPLFFLPFSFEFYEFNKQYLLFFLVSIACFAWLVRMVLVEKEIRFKRTLLDIPVLIFVSAAVLSALFSVDKQSSLFGFYGRFSDGLIGLLGFAILYFLITNNAGTGDGKVKNKNAKPQIKNESEKASGCPPISIKGLLKTFLCSSFFAVLIGYFSIFGIWEKLSSLLSGGGMPQFMLSRFFNPVTGSLEGLAVFASALLVLLTSRFVMGIEGRLAKFINWIFFFALFFLLVLVGFKTAWLIVFLASLIFVGVALWKRMFRKDVNRLLLPIFLVVVAGVFMFANSSEILRTFSPDIFPVLPQERMLDSGQSLIVGAKASVGSVKNAFLGTGIGTFHYDFAKFKTADFNENALWQIRFDRSSNHIAEILGTTGFLGLLSYGFLLAMVLMLGYFSLERFRQVIPYLALFLALLLAQFVYYQNMVLAFSFWLALAFIAVALRKPDSEKTISFSDFPELSLVFSVVVIILGLALLAGYFFAASFYLADINYRQAVWGGEMEKLEKAAELNPYQPYYKIILGRAYLDKALLEVQKPEEERDQVALSADVYLAITYLKGGQIGTRMIKGATEMAPNRVAVWENLGVTYRNIQGMASGSLDWAMKSFENAVALEPASPVLHTELGKLYLVAEKAEEAKKEFEKAKELKPDYIDAVIQLAGVYEEEGNLEEALKQVEELALKFPSNVDVLFQLGRLYFNNKMTDSAISQFARVVSLMPNHSNAHYSLGVIYQSRGETTKAIAEFEKVLQLNPGNQDIKARLDSLQQGD